MILGHEPQACYKVLPEKMMAANFFGCECFNPARLTNRFFNFTEKIQGEAESKTESRWFRLHWGLFCEQHLCQIGMVSKMNNDKYS